MHNSVVFYRKPHNFSFYPIIHKKVLIFQKGRPARDGLFVAFKANGYFRFAARCPRTIYSFSTSRIERAYSSEKSALRSFAVLAEKAFSSASRLCAHASYSASFS